ncbi:ankyrin repeat and SOCS box protein 13-like isoform X1 [Portunus trituberculatus]|uniref:ankyrin repeat and SOCS box protein 13-like isoform X1 n=2 Tax=Portunus trituberculatus TaxID=210409 RepID=UPI001E1D0CF6|nr:ankyrin repeat and SOCS box protein 13-like isoform X1 [Portunus trituberculatus]XP_045103596.1 ankyrin repeat and SOCS box protein 13-like isoform X1 [Portunus trituberculatus]XP_045103597.1 ankyrin repeat and SOCS box protein 13-like isoform X1 [Portunus trituberculatus]XP_045103598.1 ankyrin repeat and SOCS box protein 13-like isoform X1 [Portunus trituberculatus]
MAVSPAGDEAYTRVQLFPLHNAVASKNFKHVRDLVDDGHDINEQHYDRVTPLHMACLTGDQHITRFLLEHGAWVNAQSIDNSTPLCDACAGGSVDCVKLLLTSGALVNPPLLPATPLHEAALRGYTDIVALLVTAGADLNVNDLHYGTPLHAACSMQAPSADCIKFLLRAGASVNAIKNHKTPLHYIAMYSKSVEATQLLLAYGANAYMQDSHGCTARHLAGPSSAMAKVLAAHEKCPPSLTQCCRLAIRSQLGPARLQHITQLEAPSVLIGFLQ